jgi:hypothetical protein
MGGDWDLASRPGGVNDVGLGHVSMFHEEN